MAEAVAVMGGSTKLNICDAGLIVLAKEYNIPVFTEDMAMAKVMSRQKFLHVSLPEMVDSLVDAGKISYEEAVSVFRRISTELLLGCAKKNPEILGKYSSSWKTPPKRNKDTTNGGIAYGTRDNRRSNRND